MHKEYSKVKIYQVAEDNYSTLVKYCTILEQEGYWEQPENVLHKSIYEMLDLYVQAFLIHMAVHYNCIGEEQREFIASITKDNMFGVEIGLDIPDKMKTEVDKFLGTPPILLQLFGLRDEEKKTSVTGLFFDAILNIAIALAYLSKITETFLMSFFQMYFKKVQVFLKHQRNTMDIIDEKYIFRKLCNGEWENSNTRLLEAGENFAVYKKNNLYYLESNKSQKKVLVRNRENEADAMDQFTRDKNENEDYDLVDNASLVLDKKFSAPEEEMILEIKENNREERLNLLLEELNQLIGLEDVKSEVISLINLIKVKKLREQYSLPQIDMSFHMVFTGNPGTGKTTVARLIASIYKELGILSNGNLVETDRSGLVAGYVGQTAIKVKEVIDRAIGGVLFIDEAYSITSSIGTNDFGSEAIDTLVKQMEDHRNDLVVIVAGYTKEMDQFLKSNTGLISRFNRFINFADYKEEELIEILCAMGMKSGFALEEDAISLTKTYLSSMSKRDKKNFGNARGIRNMFEKLIVFQANRIVSNKAFDENALDMLTSITKEDVSSYLSSIGAGGLDL